MLSGIGKQSEILTSCEHGRFPGVLSIVCPILNNNEVSMERGGQAQAGKTEADFAAQVESGGCVIAAAFNIFGT